MRGIKCSVLGYKHAINGRGSAHHHYQEYVLRTNVKNGVKDIIIGFKMFPLNL